MHSGLKLEKKVSISKWISVFSILIIIGVLCVARDKLFNYNLSNMLVKYSEKSIFIYFVICFLQPIILPFPEPITIITGSLVFGKFNGAIVGFLGTILGIIRIENSPGEQLFTITKQ